jgi:hypothetical protein
MPMTARAASSFPGSTPATDLQELGRELKRGFASSGPYLVELPM